MFWRLTMAIFRLKYLVRSYTTLIMGCIQWGGRRRDLVPTSPPTSPLYTAHKSRITAY